MHTDVHIYTRIYTHVQTHTHNVNVNVDSGIETRDPVDKHAQFRGDYRFNRVFRNDTDHVATEIDVQHAKQKRSIETGKLDDTAVDLW